ISGAAVVDTDGRCVGVFSAFDLLRLVERRPEATPPAAGPPACCFQLRYRDPDGPEGVLCTLPPGGCAVQPWQKEPGGREVLTWGQPRGMFCDWQLVQVERLPANPVREFMTADPVTVSRAKPVRTLAQQMVDAHIHRLFVVDEARRPV